jgi:hypothetical protein
VKLSAGLLLKLSRKYEPSAMISIKLKGKDVLFKTDDQGDPILLFIGKATGEGKIRGQRYTRTLQRDSDGILVKDHWDLKGKAT